MAVLVLARVEGSDGPVLAARGDHRDLALEVDEALEHRRRAADGLPGCPGLGGVGDAHLSLAVVAEAPGL